MKIRFFPREKKDQSGEAEKPLPSFWRILSRIAWALSAIMILFLAVVIFQKISGQSILQFIKNLTASRESQTVSSLPNLPASQPLQSISRKANLNTNLPKGYRRNVVEYKVESGDSIFGISKQYSLKPESILYANYSTLNDDPQMISIGTKLEIPPTDGILYEWQEGDTLDNVAGRFKANKEDILLWPGNNLDMTNPIIQPGTMIMIPGGYRELKPWVIAVEASSNAGVTAKISGPGSCTPAGGAVGSGSFIWPDSYQGQVSGNDYWGGHRGLDIMCYLGDAIFASDSGVVIYAGSIGGGYGNLVAIDHGNGWLSLYAHLSAISVRCGQSVSRGQVIASCGSTGNSTGPHLHFEVRKGSAFVNPWQVLQ